MMAAEDAADFLIDLANGGECLDGYIIGTFGDYDTLTTPRSRGSEATGLFLSGKSFADEQRVRESMLKLDKAELLRLAGVVQRLMDTSALCVFGPKEGLIDCGGILKEIREI